jgi:2-polyprenyl-3-methyl-5-hydroxy-6-metoxy-1,4-benzoquinol methylase
MLDSRYQREKEFHDRIFGVGPSSTRQAVARCYEGARSFAFYRSKLGDKLENKQVLEYGCGEGSYAFWLARKGAAVTGIDLSDVAIEQAQETASREHLEAVQFRVMNAEALGFGEDSFDMICGTGILHHLDLEKAFPEIARTLKPNGKAVFVEPLGHNPFINLYRKCTPRMRTVDEHPLLIGDLARAENFFQKVETHYFQLLTISLAPFRKTRFIKAIAEILDAMDQSLFRAVPYMRRYAWQIVLELSEPRKCQ